MVYYVKIYFSDFYRFIFNRVCVHISGGVHQGQRCQIALEQELRAAKCGCWEHLSPLPELYMVTATESLLQHLGSKVRDTL